MNSKIMQGKVQAFAQRLLQDAHGDPLRALGLLVLVLEGAEVESAEHAQRLMTEVRHVLMPDGGVEIGRPVQHLAGGVSWEGVQHCLRCAKTLSRNGDIGEGPIAAGYVYEVGSRLTPEVFDDFDVCH